MISVKTLENVHLISTRVLLLSSVYEFAVAELALYDGAVRRDYLANTVEQIILEVTDLNIAVFRSYFALAI